MSSVFRWFRSLSFRWVRFWHYLNGYVKIRYDFRAEEQESGFPSETLWAKPLSDDRYQLENIPVFIEELNLHDVVKCRKEPGELHVIVEVVRRSGNRTLRVEFREETSANDAANLIWALREKQIFYEKAGSRRYMFNIEPSADYKAIRELLKSKEEAGWLWLYE